MYDDEDDTDCEPERKYTVEYQAGAYSGRQTVWAVDEEQAIAKVQRKIRREMTLPMYYEHYKVVQP